MQKQDLSPNAAVSPADESKSSGPETCAPQNEISAEDASVFDAAARLEQIVEERDRLEKEKAELSDQLLRRTADFDNLRKRSERERAELIEYASTDAVRALLPVLDDFERALKMECPDEEYARGIQLIYQRLYETLKKLGLEPIEAEGKPFDPNFHHAVEMVETDGVEEHTVVADLMRGYTFKGRLLRPSMVKVASGG
jgi:molecular chaperone GrpE